MDLFLFLVGGEGGGIDGDGVGVPRDQHAGLAEDFEGAEGLRAEDVLEGAAARALGAHVV